MTTVIDMSDIQYVADPSVENPIFLARLKWPDVYQVISENNATWHDDFSMMDLLFDSSGDYVTNEQAAEIAKGWGATL